MKKLQIVFGLVLFVQFVLYGQDSLSIERSYNYYTAHERYWYYRYRFTINHNSVMPSLFTIYPNPTTGIIWIEPTENNMVYHLKIFNAYGQLIFTEQHTQGLYSFDFNMFELENGIYFLEIFTNQGLIKTTKIIFSK